MGHENRNLPSAVSSVFNWHSTLGVGSCIKIKDQLLERESLQVQGLEKRILKSENIEISHLIIYVYWIHLSADLITWGY